MKRTKFLILFLFYTSVLLIKGKLREPDEFVMYDERIGNENSRCLWNKVCRYDLQFGILVCQLKCMNFSFRSLPIFCRKKPKFEYCKLFCSGRICRKLCHFSAGERCTVQMLQLIQIMIHLLITTLILMLQNSVQEQ